MKKILIAILILAALLTITSCGIIGEKQTEIKTDAQAKQAVANLTEDLDKLGTSLDNLNEKLS